MKTIKTTIVLSALMAFSTGAAAQVSPFVSAQVDAAAKPCTDIAAAAQGQSEESAKAVAIAALQPCYDALKALDTFERENASGLSADERNYFYYVGGNIIWLTAGAETMKNDGKLTEAICQQVISAEKAWGNVRVQTGTPVHNEMLTNSLRRMLLPACTGG